MLSRRSAYAPGNSLPQAEGAPAFQQPSTRGKQSSVGAGGQQKARATCHSPAMFLVVAEHTQCGFVACLRCAHRQVDYPQIAFTETDGPSRVPPSLRGELSHTSNKVESVTGAAWSARPSSLPRQLVPAPRIGTSSSIAWNRSLVLWALKSSVVRSGSRWPGEHLVDLDLHLGCCSFRRSVLVISRQDLLLRTSVSVR